MSTLAHGFLLDALRVEPLAGLLSGPGERVKLDPKVMDVLVHMAEHAGQVVLREELLARLWPNVVVSDDALTRCFYELRRGLAHAAGDERYRTLLETVPKRGYRLNAIILPLEPAVVEAPTERLPARQRGSRRLVAGAAVGFLAVGAALYFWRASDRVEAPAGNMNPHTIAVLPFLDMSADKDQGYFSDGVTEEILNHLSQSDSLRVISRTSSFALRDEDLDVPQIAERLGVDHVLEGSVRKSGARVRITAQLIDAATNAHVWSRTFDRPVDDLFAVQDEIAMSVASAVGSTLDGARSERMPATVEAYERFLQGEFLYNRRLPGEIERAADYYRQAVALDPQYARAWAGLAGAYSLLIGEMDETTTQALRHLQGEAARKAVELDPGLAVAHARLAQYYYHVQQQELGDEHMRRAAALDPDDLLVLGFASSRAVWRDDFVEAARLWRQAVAQDPLSPVNRTNYASALHTNGQLPQALAEYQRALELNPDAGIYVQMGIVRGLVGLGRYEEAMPVIDRLPPGNIRDYALALLHRAPGRREEAEAALRRLAAAPKDIEDVIYLAEAYADRDRKDEAFSLLTARYRELELDRAARPRARWFFQDEMRRSPYLMTLRSDPRWAELATIPGRTDATPRE